MDNLIAIAAVIAFTVWGTISSRRMLEWRLNKNPFFAKNSVASVIARWLIYIVTGYFIGGFRVIWIIIKAVFLLFHISVTWDPFR